MTLIARTITIAVIATVMPLGIDISGDGVVSFGASFSHAANEGEGNPNAPRSSASAPTGDFGGSAEPAGSDLTEQEEQDLISRGWQRGGGGASRYISPSGYRARLPL
ncbi:MAG: hypothetical protein V3R90_02905 [Limibaculum sp.]